MCFSRFISGALAVLGRATSLRLWGIMRKARNVEVILGEERVSTRPKGK